MIFFINIQEHFWPRKE